MLLEFSADTVVICPVEDCSKQFNRFTNTQLQGLYNALGFPHQLGRGDLIQRLSEFCWYATPSEVNFYELQYQLADLGDEPRSDRFNYKLGSYLKNRIPVEPNTKNIFIKGVNGY